MRALTSLALLAIAPLALSGCELLTNPSAMPSGYTYHGDIYKAPPGPNSDELGYDYSAARNDEILLAWREAVDDLVNTLEETGIAAQAVYIEQPKAGNAFLSTYDNVLREELVSRGYTLGAAPGSVNHLRYEALVPESKDALPAADNADARDFVLVLTVIDPSLLAGAGKEDEAVLTQVGNTYRLPPYGYSATPSLSSIFKPVGGGAR